MSDDDNPAVLPDKRDLAMWITINRPDKRNAINKDATPMLAALFHPDRWMLWFGTVSVLSV